jgi:hypothetical protein
VYFIDFTTVSAPIFIVYIDIDVSNPYQNMNTANLTIEAQLKALWKQEQDYLAMAEKVDIQAMELIDNNPGLDIDRMVQEFSAEYQTA